MTVASEYDNSSAVVEIAGGNMHMKMNFMGVDMDIYNIDGIMYTLDSESKTYYTVDMEESIDDFKSEIGYGINDNVSAKLLKAQKILIWSLNQA